MQYDQITREGVAFVFSLAQAGTITDDQARLLADTSKAYLNEDPYGSESLVSPWDVVGHPSLMPTKRVYLVSAYHRSRRYGGPEEGGWWYDHDTPLSDEYARSHGRAFIIVGPFSDTDDAYEVARTLTACEQIGMPRGVESSIVWRVQDCLPFEGNGMVYC